MSVALYPEPDEPRGCGRPGEQDEDEGIQQGLYATVPAGELTLDGFAS
jgi:hypothetical protein